MMNESGKAVQSLTSFYKLPTANIFIVHDDLGIKLGEYKIQRGKGPKDHKGLLSIDSALGTRDYWRVRVGIENRKRKFLIFSFQFPRKITGEEYVLQNFTDKELEIINPVIDKIVKDLISRLC
jgi:PTH1 family peptidyl-tRNA hydrolase